MNPKTLSILLVLLLVSGCTESVAPEDSARYVGTPVVGYAPDGQTVPDPMAMTEAERTAYGDEQVALQIGIARAVGESTDWTEADVKVRKTLADVSLVPDFMAETLAAHSMLEAQLLPSADEPALGEAIGRYVNLLLKHESPNALLIEQALPRLEGVWTEERLASARTSTVRNADSFVAKRLGCADCTESLAQRDAALAATNNAQVRNIADAADRLRAR